MRDRTSPTAARPATRRSIVSIDVVPLTPHGRRLTAMLLRSSDPRSKEKWELPWDAARADESIDDAASRIARTALGVGPTWTEQIGAFGDQRRHPSGADVSIGYIALVPDGTPAPIGGAAAWFPVDELPPIGPRQRAIIDAALNAIRSRLDESPIAFRLLAPIFTLSQLQEIYEILLGRRLHKASFRRALHAAWLVEPTDEWRSEGSGRPAQLFRYAPKKRRGGRRGVRFEEIAG
jgi:8-oxo-dGTP diphosphatase